MWEEKETDSFLGDKLLSYRPEQVEMTPPSLLAKVLLMC